LQTWEYEPRGGLFTGYVNTFLRRKIEASGWPASVDTEDKRQAFVNRYWQCEGIKLDPSRMKANSGMRFICKIALNALWGKFSQRNNLSRTEFMADPEPLYALLADHRVEVQNILPLSDHLVMVVHRRLDDYVDEVPNTSVAIACQVTSYGRQHLYRAIEAVGSRCVYVDTDSCAFIHRRDDEATMPIQQGEMLGEWHDEYPHHRIVEWISAGPKQYAMRMIAKADGEESYVVRLRGFTLNYSAAQKLNFAAIRRMVVDEGKIRHDCDNPIAVTYSAIERNRESRVYTIEREKQYRACYRKGVLLPDLTTRPYGYKEPAQGDGRML
jgi:hypothetical protein